MLRNKQFKKYFMKAIPKHYKKNIWKKYSLQDILA